MRRPAADARLTPEQAAVADTGVKALVPIAGRPFLDYSLHVLAEVGIREICLIVGPRHEALVTYYRRLPTRRLEFVFAVQEEPRGAADALLAAADFAGKDEFLVLNSDNYYPVEVLAGLRDLGGPGLVAFDRGRFLARGGSNVTAERMAHYAILERTAGGDLAGIVEKPDRAVYAGLREPVLVSFNCWRFGHRIFEACRTVPPSSRGELELPAAVGHAIEVFGERFRMAVSDAPVLDLSNRGDVAAVESALRGRAVDL
jgi:glucose-1-phosphate thymidylyltransferase